MGKVKLKLIIEFIFQSCEWELVWEWRQSQRKVCTLGDSSYDGVLNLESGYYLCEIAHLLKFQVRSIDSSVE